MMQADGDSRSLFDDGRPRKPPGSSTVYLRDGREIDITGLSLDEVIDKIEAAGASIRDVVRTMHVIAPNLEYKIAVFLKRWTLEHSRKTAEKELRDLVAWARANP